MTTPVVINPARCDMIKRDGKQCGNQAGKGTDHKGYGRCKTHGGNAPSHKKAGARAAMLAMVLDSPDVDPYQVLMGSIQRSWAEVLFLEDKIAELDASDPTAIASSPWQKLYGEWLDRAARQAKMALDAGVAEAQVQIAKDQGRVLAGAFQAMLDGLGLTREQKQIAPQLVSSIVSRVIEAQIKPPPK